MLNIRFGFAAAAVTALVACGSNSTPVATPSAPPPPGIADTSSRATSSVRMITIQNASTISDKTGTLARSTDTLTLDGEAATVNDTVTTATFTNTALGQLDFDLTGSTQYVLAVEGTISETGVIGVPTNINDLPTGTANYVGQADLIVNDTADGAFYDLTGTVTVDVDFSGTANVFLTDMNGEVTRANTTPGGGPVAPVDVADAIDLTILGSGLSGAGFSGGTVSISSPSGDLTTTLTGTPALSHTGAFFGPDADEVGGAIIVDDTNAGTITATAVYLAD